MGLTESAAWVSLQHEERDSRRFWISVLHALRATAAGANLVRRSTPAPDLDGWAIVEHLLEDLAPLEDRIWLVIDDLHELHSGDAFRQLELLVMHAPDEVRFVLSSEQHLGLGLHRLRLEDEPTGTRGVHLRFTFDEVRGTHGLTENLDPSLLEKLAGVYLLPSKVKFEVRYQPGTGLLIAFPGAPPQKLIPVKGMQFRTPLFADDIYEFVLENGQAKSLKERTPSGEYTFERQ